MQHTGGVGSCWPWKWVSICWCIKSCALFVWAILLACLTSRTRELIDSFRERLPIFYGGGVFKSSLYSPWSSNAILWMAAEWRYLMIALPRCRELVLLVQHRKMCITRKTWSTRRLFSNLTRRRRSRRHIFCSLDAPKLEAVKFSLTYYHFFTSIIGALKSLSIFLVLRLRKFMLQAAVCFWKRFLFI